MLRKGGKMGLPFRTLEREEEWSLLGEIRRREVSGVMGAANRAKFFGLWGGGGRRERTP